ncbi:2-oxoacid dehydrogenases acyltransferase-domain-containing protein [Collybia nuda]|uniref:Dihydrolipoamide acetyltransferase component of pyruvate dehydrogenase complex n=1 Tax=Collybia nuda TaxID=64659 RepID=A0A9P5Y7E4_9AGAR|nr:2-oxoacid dehydrogenases acyltransferase-domain-containing protein [Collybia nuda]
MLAARPLRRLLGRPLAVSYFHTTPTTWASRKVVQKFKLADIGEGITECEVIKWSVQPASKIQAFDPLCEVQSDKASVEITSPFDGVIKELLVQEGEVAKVGAGLCLIEVDEEAVDGADPAAVEPVEPAPASTSTPTPTPEPTQEAPSVPRVEASKPETMSTPPRGLHPLDPNYTPPTSTSSSGGGQRDVLAAPSVRHFARVSGVDLGVLMPGSGKGGRVEKRDVEMFLARASESKTQQGQARHGQGVGVADAGQDVVVELGRTRYGMWKAMEKSLEIPHFGYSTTLDLTALHNILPTLNAHIPPHFLPSSLTPRAPLAVNPSALFPAPTPAQVPESQQYTRLTYLPILLKTLSKAMIEWPLLRASITPSTPASTSSPSPKPTLTIRPHADISIALSTPTGLYTPTLQHANTHSIYTLSAQLRHLAHLGRQTPCALTPAEMPRRGGTVSVSNVGALGAGDFAAPVLVPGGGVAIVALGRAKWVWDVDCGDGRGERRLKMGVSWSADHRVVEGAELAAFVECWRGYVEAPERLIAEGV